MIGVLPGCDGALVVTIPRFPVWKVFVMAFPPRMSRSGRPVVVAVALAMVASCGLGGQGRAVAAPVTDGDSLFSDQGAGVAAPAAAAVPQSVKDAVARAKWKAPAAKDLNHTPRGKAADRSKKWRYVQDAASAGTATAGRTSTAQRTATSDGVMTAAAVSSVDATIPAPGLGIQSFYGMQEFGVRDGLSVGVNLGNGNLVVRAQDLSNNAPGAAITNDRFYNSLSGRVGGFGQRWGLSGGQDVGLEVDASQIVFRGQSGFRAKFTGSGSTWTAPSGLNAKLTKNGDGSFKLVANGSRVTMNFDSAGNLTKVTDRNGVGFSYTYEPAASSSGQRVASAIDAVGRVTNYSYDGADRITAITDSANRQVKYGYDTAGRLTSSLDALGQETRYDYDGSGRLCRITTSRGVTLDITYDSAGKVASVSRYEQVNAGGQKQTTSFAFASGSTVVTNPLGKKWTHTIDTQGRVTKVVDPLGVTKNRTWTSNSMIASAWEADASAITSFSYDTNNNPSKVSLPTGASSSAVYSAGSCGEATTAGTATDLQQCGTDDAGNTQAYTYDSAGNQLTATDTKAKGGASVSKTYAKPGSTDVNTNCSRFAGQLCSVTNGKGNTTRFLYDDNGNLTKITPPTPLGAVTYTYDSLGRMTFVSKGTGASNSYEYDANDRFVQATYGATNAGPETTQLRVFDADGNLHGIDSQVFDFDGQNRLEKTTNEAGETRWVGRDAAGNINVIADVGNVMTNYTYNAANQVTSAAWHGVNCPLDGASNSNLPSGCVKFGYDGNGRLSSMVYPGNVTTTPTWDKAGRQTGVKTVRGGTSPQTILDQSYGYATASGADRFGVQTLTDRTGDFVPAGAVTTYGYDSLNRVISAVEKTTAGATNASWVYAYDKDGNRITANASGPGVGGANNVLAANRSVDHNHADELTVINGSGAGLGWDANGDETANPGWLDGSVAARSDVRTSSAGDVTQWTRSDTSQVFNFTSAQVLPTGPRNLTWAHEVSYTWNPVGLESYTSPNGQGQVKLFTLPNGQTLGYQVNGTMEYLHKDRLGSVVAMTTDAGGKDAYYRYDPYGMPRSYYRWSDAAKANILMYTGAPRDFSTGLVRMGARWYDPAIGRFTTADPSGQEQNPYLYAAGNPINSVDPQGLSVRSAFAGGIAGIGLGLGAGLVATAMGGPVAGAITFGVVSGGAGAGLANLSDQRESGGPTNWRSVAGYAGVGALLGGLSFGVGSVV